jgi:hypothetical protein
VPRRKLSNRTNIRDSRNGVSTQRDLLTSPKFREKKPALMGRFSLLPKSVATENYEARVVVSIGEARESRKRLESRKSWEQRRAEREHLAVEWGRQLKSGDVPSRAALARREGVSRAWVTKVLG